MRRLDYPACAYDPDAELVEDDRRRQLGMEPCRALVHGEDVWELHQDGRWMRGRYTSESPDFGEPWWPGQRAKSDWSHLLLTMIRRPSRAGYLWQTIWDPGSEVPF